MDKTFYYRLNADYKFPIVVKTLYGLEEILSDEIALLGGENINIGNRMVELEGDLELIYKINLHSYFALRVLVPLKTLTLTKKEDLYNAVYAIEWEEYMNVNQTFKVDSVVFSEIFNHSQYVAQYTKDAIVDRFKEKKSRRPNVHLQKPDLVVNVHIFKNECSISLDSSGDSLHRRGYKAMGAEAPLNEVLAAAMVKLSGWNPEIETLYNPMCGSGTIAMEAFLQAKNIAPGIFRRTFAFMNWNDYNADLWEKLKIEAIQNKSRAKTKKIIASDIKFNDVETITKSLDNIGAKGTIELLQEDFLMYKKEVEKPACLIINPPYGERLQEDDITEFYREIGDTLKTNYVDCDAWIISSSLEAMKFIGLRPSRKIKLFNGSLECKFQKFELYQGSKKDKYQEEEEE